MDIAVGDRQSPQDAPQERRRKKPTPARQPYVLKLGPFELEIPWGMLPTPVLTLLAGVGLTLSVMSGVEDLATSGAIPLITNWLIPPQIVTEVSDARSGASISPARKTYVVKPDQALVFRQKPGSPPLWVSILTEGYGMVDPPNQAASEVRYYAPSLAAGVPETAGLIQACSGDPADPERARCDPPIVITTRATVR